EPVRIELLNPLDRVYAGEWVPLHLVVRCAPDGPPAELRSVSVWSHERAAAELDSDLFERDLRLMPGEVYRCSVLARFHRPGVHPNPPFFIQVGRDTETVGVNIPTPQIRVVPLIAEEVKVAVESIYTSGHGTKIDVTLRHIGTTQFDDFRLVVGPSESVSAGVSDHRRPVLAPGDVVRFNTVLHATTLELELDGTAGGERVGPVPLRLGVPAVQDTATAAPFRFLEPKKLSNAAVEVRTMDDAGELVTPASNVYAVHGGGTKYRVEITPEHPNTQQVSLRSVPGSVEVTRISAVGKKSAFQMVVLTSGVLTTPVTLHFDVTTPEGEQQGELNLAVRPLNGKLWLVALTAGFAVTVKGFAAIVPALTNPSDLWANAGAALGRVHNVWDLVQLASIPIIRGGLWGVDLVTRPFRDG
ncbi:MAG TPA: hypothetical protein VMZ71_13175, partial [Gemmataceae bacterium]|nr:hypothetical protein [Gemmataceae bacterium]